MATFETDAPVRDPNYGQPRFAKGVSGALYLVTRNDEYICIIPTGTQSAGDQLHTPHLPDLHVYPAGTVIKITA